MQIFLRKPHNNKTIVISEQQLSMLRQSLNETRCQFSIEYLRNNKWKTVTEIINYCQNCGLLNLGSGTARTTFRIDDDKVIKVAKFTPSYQNRNEVETYLTCDNTTRNIFPQIFDWDKLHKSPAWIISEQVLPASAVDFHKIAGIDFGYYLSQYDIDVLKQDLKDYQKYKGKKIDNWGISLFSFLEAYDFGDEKNYQWLIQENELVREVYNVLEKGLADSNELTLIENWGLVKRNGKPKLVILDTGI